MVSAGDYRVPLTRHGLRGVGLRPRGLPPRIVLLCRGLAAARRCEAHSRHPPVQRRPASCPLPAMLALLPLHGVCHVTPSPRLQPWMPLDALLMLLDAPPSCRLPACRLCAPCRLPHGRRLAGAHLHAGWQHDGDGAGEECALIASFASFASFAGGIIAWATCCTTLSCWRLYCIAGGSMAF